MCKCPLQPPGFNYRDLHNLQAPQFLHAVGSILFPELPTSEASLPMGATFWSIFDPGETADSSKAAPGAVRSIDNYE